MKAPGQPSNLRGHPDHPEMTITDALKIAKPAPADVPRFSVRLACGFTPLQLETLLKAHLQLRLPARQVEISTGLYGDLAGTLEGAAGTAMGAAGRVIDGIAVALEWSDLDLRLGYRNAGAWGIDTAEDVARQAGAMLSRLAAAVLRLPEAVRIAVTLPSLPLPPFFHTPGWQTSPVEARLERDLMDFACRLAGSSRVSIVSARQLAEESPPAARYDIKADLSSGLPYTLLHADKVAQFLAQSIVPPTPKKGIITDLDDTLWCGLLGEVGVDGIGWDLASHSQLHGLYQTLLSHLSEQGVLIAVASKNEAALVEQAFARPDLRVLSERVFPMEISWNAKSASVARILEVWNISADSVIFIDDSPMELAEVAAAHLGIECIAFPKDDPAAGLALLRRLRDLCGKEQISRDDTTRLESIRHGAVFRSELKIEAINNDEAAMERFLEQAQGKMVFDESAGRAPRTLDLVNKTNQFNLNGLRYTAGDWETALARPGAFALTTSYEDRFGPLGLISVLQGRLQDRVLRIDVWVLSCRAFSRRIEYQCLRTLFQLSAAAAVEFQFERTSKNGPMRDFLAALFGQPPAGNATLRLTLPRFEQRSPALHHEVQIVRRAVANG